CARWGYSNCFDYW
nr:immunoglobulin heavy chain junction region [Mus musculus]MBK4188822.1 immunoglobulin heavy chain junction region [Mus musculus]